VQTKIVVWNACLSFFLSILWHVEPHREIVVRYQEFASGMEGESFRAGETAGTLSELFQPREIRHLEWILGPVDRIKLIVSTIAQCHTGKSFLRRINRAGRSLRLRGRRGEKLARKLVGIS